MDNDRDAAKPRQTLRQRLLWFFAGAGVNYLLIATPFKYLQTHTSLTKLEISACSMGVSSSFFFVWNYFFNFRTDVRKRHALARYATVVVILWAISSPLLAAFKKFDANLSLNLGKYPVDLDVVALQACLGWMKFIIYHKWAFPVAKKEPGAATKSTSEEDHL